MKTYTIKNIDPELWRKVKMYCYYENVRIGDKILSMLASWVETIERFEDETRRLNSKGNGGNNDDKV